MADSISYLVPIQFRESIFPAGPSSVLSISLSFYRNDLPASGRTVKEVETWSLEEVGHLRRKSSEHLRRKLSERCRCEQAERLRRKPSEHLHRKPFDRYRRLSAVWQHSQLAVLNSVDSLLSLL